MKRVTASEARRSWFRLLDEVVDGAVVVIERAGKRILIRREDSPSPPEIPDYESVISARAPERAAEWSWVWPGPEGELSLADDCKE